MYFVEPSVMEDEYTPNDIGLDEPFVGGVDVVVDDVNGVYGHQIPVLGNVIALPAKRQRQPPKSDQPKVCFL